MSDSTLKELWQQVAEKKSCEAKQKEPVSYTHLDVYKRQEILGPVQHGVGITGACAVKPLLCLRKGRTVQIGRPG